jgi:hypothetical protein
VKPRRQASHAHPIDLLSPRQPQPRWFFAGGRRRGPPGRQLK